MLFTKFCYQLVGQSGGFGESIFSAGGQGDFQGVIEDYPMADGDEDAFDVIAAA